MEKDFTIDKVAWHTGVKDNPESPAEVKRRFRILVGFLQSNGLTVRSLLGPNEEPNDEFAIRSDDLTSEGLEVIKKGYDTWLKKIVNKKKDLTDTSILAGALAKIREF